MKFQILNNEELGFFNDVGNKTAVIKMSGSNMVFNPISSGDIIMGDNNVVNDIEIGIDSISSNMTFLGGGTISSNAGTLYIGDGVNDDKVVLTGVTIGSSVNFSAGLTGSFQGSFTGDGSNITGITATTAPGGNNKTIQFNDNNTATGGNNNFTFDKTTNIVELTGSINVSGSSSADYFFGDGSGLTNISGVFPFTGSAKISESLEVNGRVTATEFYGNGSQLTGVVASFSPTGDVGSIQFKKNNTVVSGSSDILYDFANNSLLLTGHISSSTLNSPGANLTGSFSGSFAGDGSNITGISGVFPYTGNATINGGLTVTGSGKFTNPIFLIGSNGPAGSIFEFTTGSNTYDSMLIFRPTGNPSYNSNYWGSIRFNPSNESGLSLLAANYKPNIIFGRGTPSTSNPTAFGHMSTSGLRLETSYLHSIAAADEKLHVIGNSLITGYITSSEIRNTNINAQSTTGRIQYNGSDRITWGSQTYIDGFDGIGVPSNQGNREFHINKLKFYETSGVNTTRIQPLLMQGHIQGKICIEGSTTQNYNYGTPGGDVYLYGGTDPYYGNGDGNVVLGLTSASVDRGRVGVKTSSPITDLGVNGGINFSFFTGSYIRQKYHTDTSAQHIKMGSAYELFGTAHSGGGYVYHLYPEGWSSGWALAIGDSSAKHSFSGGSYTSPGQINTTNIKMGNNLFNYETSPHTGLKYNNTNGWEFVIRGNDNTNKLIIDSNGNTEISGALSIPGFPDVSASLASAGSGGAAFPHTGSAIISGSLIIEGGPLDSSVFEVNGTQGQLFSITDSLSGSLFAVSDVSGLPILEVFSDDTIKMGSFNNEALEISGSDVNFNNLPTSDPGVSGTLFQTGSDAIGATAGFQVICISQG